MHEHERSTYIDPHAIAVLHVDAPMMDMDPNDHVFVDVPMFKQLESHTLMLECNLSIMSSNLTEVTTLL